MAATNVPPTSVGELTPGDRGFAYRDVEFPASDGVRLSGWYISGGNGAGVVVLHGAGSTRSDVLDHAAVVAANGFAVLLFDARGHGRSAGRAMDFGWYGDDDVGGAVSFLAAQPGVSKIGVVGLSMGGEEAIGAAGSDARIGAVVAEGATNRVAGDKAWLAQRYGLRGWLQRPIDWLTYGATDVLTDARAPVTLRAAAARTQSPILLITAGEVADEAGAARYIASGSPATVVRWDVPGTGHTRALATHPLEWERRVVAFLASASTCPRGRTRSRGETSAMRSGPSALWRSRQRAQHRGMTKTSTQSRPVTPTISRPSIGCDATNSGRSGRSRRCARRASTYRPRRRTSASSPRPASTRPTWLARRRSGRSTSA